MFYFQPNDTFRQVCIYTESYAFVLSVESFRDGIDQAKMIFLELRKLYRMTALTEQENADLDLCLSVARDYMIDQGYID